MTVLETFHETDHYRSMSEGEKPRGNPFELLTVQQVAAIKGVSRTAVYNAMGEGKLRSQRIGKIIVLLRADVDAWQPRPRGPKKGWKNDPAGEKPNEDRSGPS